MSQFAAFRLAPSILRALTDEGYHTPTPIQARAVGPILEGRDLLGSAQTGTGKTAAFALPILSRLCAAAPDHARRGPALPRVLVLAPTRELATQIGESFAAYGRHTGLTHTTIFGGVSQVHQVRALRRGVDIVVATPGRLMDLMEQRLVDFTAISVLVLDEADRMLDMGFIQPIRRIVAALPSPRQTLLFSATMPREIAHLADSLLRDPVRVTVAAPTSAPALIEQSVYMVGRHDKQSLLEHLLEEPAVTRAVVFTKTKHGADRVRRRLTQAGIHADAIHGNKAQNQRQRTLAGFRAGRCRVLVATDVAARGLDVDGISHVFNFDLPLEPEAYLHRIGRTGRAGAAGIAISFCDREERGLLRGIERLAGRPLRAITQLPPLPEPAHAAADHRDGSPGRTEHDSPARFNGSPGPRNPPTPPSRRPPHRGKPAHGHGLGRPSHSAGPGSPHRQGAAQRTRPHAMSQRSSPR